MALSYNGHTFDRFAKIQIQCSQVYDESNRTVIGYNLTVDVTAVVLPGSTGGVCHSDNHLSMEAIKNALQVPGARLLIEDIGFGPRVDINGPDNTATGWQVDIDNGPKPQVVGWKPIGHNQAAEVTWRVTTMLAPGCPELSSAGLRSLTYSSNYQHNEKGFTTRTIAGVITVSTGASADAFRERIVVTKLTNSQRFQNYRTSPDKLRCEFTIVDRENESPNAYPAGVIRISAPTKTSINYPNPKAVVGQVQLNVSLELEARQPRTQAWVIFNAIFAARIADYLTANVPIIVTRFDMEEDWFTHEYRFSITYQVATAWNVFLNNSTYFQAYPVTWAAWSASMANAQGPRGQGLFNAANNAASNSQITLCNTSATGITVTDNVTEYFRGIGTIAALCNSQPAAQYSWMKYDSELIERPELQETVGYTYGETNVTQNASDVDPSSTAASQPMMLVSFVGGQVNVIKASSPPKQRWQWRGHAQRLGYPIPPMGKITIGGQSAKIVGTPMISNRQVGYLMCQPLYEAVWNVGLEIDSGASPSSVSATESNPTTVNNDYQP